MKTMNDEPEQLRREHMMGMTFKAIAEKYYMDQRTAKRYVEMNLPLSELEHRSYTSKLDPYKPVIDEEIQKDGWKYKSLYDSLKENGYTGSYHLLYRYVRRRIIELEEINPPAAVPQTPSEGMISVVTGPANPGTIEERIRKEKEHAANHT